MRAVRMGAFDGPSLGIRTRPGRTDSVIPSGVGDPGQWAGSVTNGPLASLAGGPLASRFHAWRGVSGKRYVFSVFWVDGCEPAEFADAVLIAAAVEPNGRRRIAFLGETGPLPKLVVDGAAVGRAREAGAAELHIHFAAPTAAARRAAIRDLTPRHAV